MPWRPAQGRNKENIQDGWSSPLQNKARSILSPLTWQALPSHPHPLTVQPTVLSPTIQTALATWLPSWKLLQWPETGVTSWVSSCLNSRRGLFTHISHLHALTSSPEQLWTFFIAAFAWGLPWADHTPADTWSWCPFPILSPTQRKNCVAQSPTRTGSLSPVTAAAGGEESRTGDVQWGLQVIARGGF